MTDFTSNSPALRASKPPKAEYSAYFALIFAAALPFAVVRWAAHGLAGVDTPNRGPVARALTQARTITPMIFSA